MPPNPVRKGADKGVVLEVFREFDHEGDSTIESAVMVDVLKDVVLEELGISTWTDEKIQGMFEAAGASQGGRVNVQKFLAWVFRPKAEEEEEGDTDDELEMEEDLADVSLDLSQKVKRDKWIAIMDRMEIEENEANEIYDEVLEESVAAGLGSAEEGCPLREFLDELKIELEDHDALETIAKAIAYVEEKGTYGDPAPPKPAGAPAAPSNMALNPALDKVMRHLVMQGKKPEDLWDLHKRGELPLSNAGRLAVASFEGQPDALVEKVKAAMISPPLLPATAGQTACHERCKAEVDGIVERCRAAGTKFTDPDWDPAYPNALLYVDREKPGYDCTVAKPAAYKRITEIVASPVLFKDDVRAGDIVQGQIGTCFLLGAVGAIVSNNENAIKLIFMRYNVELGVYGVRFNLDGEWIYVIVDDYMPVDEEGRLLFARSKDPEEVWVPLIEKAFCKLHTCYEMCDGGVSNEAIFNFYGGVNGKLELKDKHREDPKAYFKALKQARSHGWLLTTHFSPKADAAGGGQRGKCGESTFTSGLVAGHCYSILKLREACGNQLVCCRNPWGTGEWLGKWSDKNEYGEWTDEMKKATEYQGLNDGKFWMSIEDFVANCGGVHYARPFGPSWHKITQYKTFQHGPMIATAQWAFKARSENELSFDKKDELEVKSIQAGWWYGHRRGSDGKAGFFPGVYVKLNDRPVARFDLVGTKSEGVVGDMTAVVMLIQPDVTRERKYYQRKEDGLNYKDTSYACLQLSIVGPDGKVHMTKQGRRRCIWGELRLPGGGQWRIYAYSVDGLSNFFSLRAYVKDGTCTLQEVPDTKFDELHAAMSKKR